MDLTALLNTGERVDIEINQTGYKTMVHNVPDVDTFLVSQPTKKGIPVRPEMDSPIRVTLYRSNGLYSLVARMSGRQFADNLICLRLIALTEPVKQQRRHYHRLEIMLPVIVRIYKDAEMLEQAELLDTYCADFSAGGLRFYADKIIPMDTHCTCELDLGDGAPLVVAGSTRRCVWPSTPGERFRVGVEFQNCSEKMRAQISKYVFVKQAASK